MKLIHFIVNPKAGIGNNPITLEFLGPYFEAEVYTLKVKFSKYKKHAILLTQDSIREGAHIIVACGGDGTINEVASCLVGTDILFGIIPVGSGNGLASNLRIPKDLKVAIALIKEGRNCRIDVGSINDRFFFSNMGIGFDASVIKNYEISGSHTLTGYLRASLKSFREWDNKEEVEIYVNKSRIEVNPFMIFISNSNELGYNVSLTPKASLQDGLLDLIVIPQTSKFKILWFGILLLLRKHHLLKEVKSYQTKGVKIYKKENGSFETQVDGELYHIDNDSISISLQEQSLCVIS